MWMERYCLNHELEEAKDTAQHARRHYFDKEFSYSDTFRRFYFSDYGKNYFEQKRIQKSKNKILNI